MQFHIKKFISLSCLSSSSTSSLDITTIVPISKYIGAKKSALPPLLGIMDTKKQMLRRLR